MPEINGDVTCVPLADYWANHFKSFLFNGICPCFSCPCFPARNIESVPLSPHNFKCFLLCAKKLL